jgi:hypothetical protein
MAVSWARRPPQSRARLHGRWLAFRLAVFPFWEAVKRNIQRLWIMLVLFQSILG